MHYRIVADSSAISTLTQDIETTAPEFTIRNSVSILISSEFLGMEDLIHDSLIFIGSNLQDIIKLNFDLNCIPDNLILKLAHLMTPHNIEYLKETVPEGVSSPKLPSIIIEI